jgi:hypothetical protein
VREKFGAKPALITAHTLTQQVHRSTSLFLLIPLAAVASATFSPLRSRARDDGATRNGRRVIAAGQDAYTHGNNAVIGLRDHCKPSDDGEEVGRFGQTKDPASSQSPILRGRTFCPLLLPLSSRNSLFRSFNFAPLQLCGHF